MKQIDIAELSVKLTAIRNSMLAVEETFRGTISQLHPNYRYSGLNFIRYLHLRQYKLKKYQEALSNLGLSSFGHSERYTLSNLENTLYILNALQGKEFTGLFPFAQHPVNYYKSKEILRDNTKRLFNFGDRPYNTSIMVTLPTEAGENPDLVNKLIASGMTIARINCSHDNPEIWKRMILFIKEASDKQGIPCQIYMDLAGPKLRTGPVHLGYRKNKKKVKKPIDFINIREGDVLWLMKDLIKGENAKRKKDGTEKSPAKISVSLPSIFGDVTAGDRIYFDDGAIAGTIEEIKKNHLTVRIRRTNRKGRLRQGKGINLPSTHLSLPSLTSEDISNLPFIVEHADMVGYSFVRSAEDVQQLQDELSKLKRPDIGIVLKVETKDAFDNFPNILLQAMKSPSIGVMIARGDLAVELGSQRISEVQEQLLWLCEAAMIPNIWATQVLEKLAKEGLPTRAEISDAAMSARAECVMLNKGPHILEAVNVLSDILARMKDHQHKKKGTLRALKVAKRFFRDQQPV